MYRHPFRILCRYGARFQLRRASSYCLLFPGQGSQVVGMGRRAIAAGEAGVLPGVAEVFKVAEKVLGYDLKDVILNGPQSLLDETVHCQPAVVVTSLAAMETLELTNPWVISAAAGFSVGEITALIVGKSLSLEQGLHLVSVRAAAMQEACKITPSSMLTVIGLEEEALKTTIDSVKSSNNEVSVANYIFPRGFVVSGNMESVKQVGREAEKLGATLKEVKVSGAFHSTLMKPAVPKLEAVLADMDVALPAFPVYSNATGLPYDNVEEIRTGLAMQVTSPVLWDATIRHMISSHFKDGDKDGTKLFLEVGPGKQLKSMMKRIDRRAYRSCDNITV